MSHPNSPAPPVRFFGLDIHKHYLVAVGVNAAQEIVLGPTRVELDDLTPWAARHLSARDALAVEMTTNTYPLHDELAPRVHSITVVHPPHLALIVRSQIKTDKRAAMALAQLLAAGLLIGVWVPPQEVRQWRALVAERSKIVRQITQAKNRLHAVLHRHHLSPPHLVTKPFHPAHKDFWLNLPVAVHEKLIAEIDWTTLEFLTAQKKRIEAELATMAAGHELVPLLVQLPGFSYLSAIAVLAAIGDIHRFASAKQLVGYAGLGARVHISGNTHTTGRITKAGRKDLRYWLVEAAQKAVRTHPHWKAQYQRLEGRIGSGKAMVAVARRMLVAVWHILTDQAADRHSDELRVARSFLKHAYTIGAKKLPDGQSALQFTRNQLDRLGIGQNLTALPWRRWKSLQLPPSQLNVAAAEREKSPG